MADSILLQQYLNGAISRNPQKIAVTDGTSGISYGELSVLSNNICHGLRSMGVARQDRVAICLRRSVHFLPAILGTLKADAIYVPLDHKAPAERLAHIIEDAAPQAVICDKATALSARQAIDISGSRVPIMALCSEDEVEGEVVGLERIKTFGGKPPVCLNDRDDIAYILYTSGSTGRPKGVMISHANVQAYIDWACSFFNIGEDDRILGTAPFHFDMSTFDIYCALKVSATLCVADEVQTLFPQRLVEFIEQQQVTLWKGVSSLLMYLARAGVLTRGAMPTLRQVIFAGETLPTRYLVDWMTVFPEITYYNAYGPTETTGVSTCYRIESLPQGPHVRIPIGTPRQGIRVLLLTDDQSEVAAGEIGELCIAGQGLARGYLNDSEKTARAFIESPLNRSGERIYKTGDLARLLPDGNLEYLGRKDRQLKFMGYRIEAEEIEQVLLAIPQIKDAAVDLVKSRLNEGVLELAAFCETEEDIDSTLISAELKKKFPSYMIPRRFIRVAKMPRCERGKIKLDALREYSLFA